MGNQMLIEKLMKFGLTRQEAILYILLVEQEQLTGYEAAKLTGISRSNTYSALAGLADKGAAYVMEGASTRYVPVSAEEFCKNKINQLKEERDYLIRHMPAAREAAEGYITIEGYTNVLDKIRNMLESTRHRIYISITAERISFIRKELEGLIRKGCKVVLITDEDVEFEGAVIYQTDARENQLRLIIDSARVLTGEFGSTHDICLYSGQQNLVDVLKDALRNEIRLLDYEARERI